MAIEYIGLKNIEGPLVVLEGVTDASYDEVVSITLSNGQKRMGRVITISGDKAVIQVYEGTTGISLTNTRTKMLGKPMELALRRYRTSD